nr:hypothetical protein BaRGS_027173 [Batillaria attramentaria]
MEKNEETANTESGDDTADKSKDKGDENKEEEKTVTDKENDAPLKQGDQESEVSEEKEKEEADNDNETEENNENETTENNENEPAENNSVSSDASIVVTDAGNDNNGKNSTTSGTTTTTSTSHLYTVLMAPLDGRGSIYKGDVSTRSSGDETDGAQKKRIRLDNASEKSGTEFTESSELGKPAVNTDSSVGIDLTKNQKRKLKKKRRKHLLNRLEVQRAKEFIYSSENEQFTVEKLRTMVEDVTEFLDAIWDVYCSEARLKGESVEEDGYRAAAVLKCLSASGEGSWADLQLLSRAKSVLVLRSKNLAASTITRVENELGYDSDELVVFELLQLSEYTDGAIRLASFSTNARDFLYPYPSLAPTYSSTDREILLSRTVAFPGISPKLEFATKTVIRESISPEVDALEDALEQER